MFTDRFTSRVRPEHPRASITTKVLHGSLGTLLAGTALLCAAAAADFLLPLAIRLGIDDGVSKDDLHVVTLIAIGSLILVALSLLTNLASGKITGLACERVIYRLRVLISTHALRLPMRHYEGTARNGLVVLMTNDMDIVSDFLRNDFFTSVGSTVSFVGVLVATVLASSQAGLVFGVGLPVLGAITMLVRRRMSHLYPASRQHLATATGGLRANLSRLWAIQMFSTRAESTRELHQAGDDYRKVRTRIQFLNALYFPGVDFVGILAVAAIVAIGTGFRTITVGLLIALIMYMGRLFSIVQQFSQVYDGYKRAMTSYRRIREFFALPEEVEAPESLPMPKAPKGHIRFSGVSMRYPDADVDTIDNVSFEMRPGETVAVVGRTGSGKSTLAKLLLGFYQPREGSIHLDGVDIRRYRLADLRGALGYVQQVPFLFDGTVSENIGYSLPNFGAEDVYRAAEAVGAHEVICGLPEGYQTRVGDHGSLLSSGQRQLVTLARAELLNPRVLVLDEVTANLDPASEGAYLAAMRALSAGRTTLVIAHRLSTAELADRVIVVDRGRIVENGSHAELLERKGSYERLWRNWRKNNAQKLAI